MFGTGPFITLPFLLDSVTPAGPHALIGYATAAGLCFVDSMVWAELGALWPESGGTQTYLLRTFGGGRLGELLAFLFTWQFLLAGPLEVASGFVAVSAYLQCVPRDRDAPPLSLSLDIARNSGRARFP